MLPSRLLTNGSKQLVNIEFIVTCFSHVYSVSPNFSDNRIRYTSRDIYKMGFAKIRVSQTNYYGGVITITNSDKTFLSVSSVLSTFFGFVLLANIGLCSPE